MNTKQAHKGTFETLNMKSEIVVKKGYIVGNIGVWEWGEGKHWELTYIPEKKTPCSFTFRNCTNAMIMARLVDDVFGDFDFSGGEGKFFSPDKKRYIREQACYYASFKKAIPGYGWTGLYHNEDERFVVTCGNRGDMPDTVYEAMSFLDAMFTVDGEIDNYYGYLEYDDEVDISDNSASITQDDFPSVESGIIAFEENFGSRWIIEMYRVS